MQAPPESLHTRRTPKQAASELAESRGRESAETADAERQWAEQQGLPAAAAAEDDGGGFSSLLRGFQTVEDHFAETPENGEEEAEEDEGEEGEYGTTELEQFGEDEETSGQASERKAARKRSRPPRRVRRAMRTLREAGYPEAHLRKLDADDLVEWALELREDQIATGSSRRLAEAPGEPTQRARPARTEEDTGGEDVAPTVALDLGAKLKAFADEMGISEDKAGATLGPLLNHVANEAAAAAVRSLRPELGQLQASNKESTEERGQRVMRENLERLTVFHPDLEDDHLMRDELLEKAGAFWKAGLYESPEEAFDDAYRATIGPMESPEKKIASKRRRARRNGPATIPRGARTAKVSRTYEDYEKDVFRARVLEGRNFEQLQKIRKPTRKSTRKEKARLL